MNADHGGGAEVMGMAGGPLDSRAPMRGRISRTAAREDEPPETDARLQRADGRLAWDPTTVWYYGNSQGGSVGTVVMALTTDVTRGVLGVPGSGYPLLLHRSSLFGPFSSVISLGYRAPDSIAIFLALLGTGWDTFDPLTFSPHLVGDPLPGTPDHEVLFHVAKEDRQVGTRRACSAPAQPARADDAGGASGVPSPETPHPASPGAALDLTPIPDDPTPLDPPDGDPSA
jgi:hypothetical protein